jgi:hypothetical protein
MAFLLLFAYAPIGSNPRVEKHAAVDFSKQLPHKNHSRQGHESCFPHKVVLPSLVNAFFALKAQFP